MEIDVTKKKDSAAVAGTKPRTFCDELPREVWRRCKDELRCIKCTKRYSDWRSLRKHMNYFCQMEPLYPCPYCSHRARLPTLLKYHVVREHAIHWDGLAMQGPKDLAYNSANKSIFVCYKCGKGYTSRTILYRHLSTVCGTPLMHRCNVCGYKTSRKDVLYRHIRHVHRP
nr:PREDICTED: zinc finger protein 711-like [Linepithema humile]